MPVDVVKRGIDLHAEVDMYLLDDEVVVSVTHVFVSWSRLCWLDGQALAILFYFSIAL